MSTVYNDKDADTLELELTCSASLFSFAALRISVTSPTAKPVYRQINVVPIYLRENIN